VVVITAYAAFDSAVEAVKLGARDYLPKPFTPAQIRHVLNQVAERRRLGQEVTALREWLQETTPEAVAETRSPRMRATLELLGRAAASEAAVLLRGESGTGKSVLARWLHAKSARAGRPFVVVSCPTLSADLLTSELFGHARGAFTGAVKDQPGRVEAAQGGTLFLDEVAEMALALQAKLLRFLQDKEFERVGETRSRRADVRLVTATNRDLEAEVKEGRFREDLFYRLHVIEATIPALRERPEDVLPLARHFLAFFARVTGKPEPELSAEGERAIAGYGWPGNVRELRNAMERAVVLSPGRRIGPEWLPEGRSLAAVSAPAIGSDLTLEELERRHLEAVVARAPTLEEAARILGIDSSTLWRKRKQYEKDH